MGHKKGFDPFVIGGIIYHHISLETSDILMGLLHLYLSTSMSIQRISYEKLRKEQEERMHETLKSLVVDTKSVLMTSDMSHQRVPNLVAFRFKTLV